MTGWLCALALALIAGFLLVRQRRGFRADLDRIGRVANGEDAVGEFYDGEHAAPLAGEVAKRIVHLRDEKQRLEHDAVNLQTILLSMDDGVMVVDSQHVIRFVNPAFREILAVNGEPIGQAVSQALEEPDFEEIVTAVLKTGDAREREVTRTIARQPRYFTVSAMPLREARGNPGVVMIFRDVSRLRQLEDVRKEFVANVSHELRTPLSIFQGYVETLIDNPDLPPDDVRPMFEVMRKHSHRLNALVEDLLILARLESRDEQLHLASLDVAQFLAESLADWRMRAAEKKIALVAEVTVGLPAIQADAFRLEQVIGNLLDNGIKYTEPGGRVTVCATAADAGVEIRVEDTGLGIPSEDVPRIFERFYRADKARSREHGGTGLGLSIVKHIVLAHGGTVRAESELGRGTTIILRLPVNPPTPVATPPGA